MSAAPARRVSVVGSAGSGKTTTARRIAQRLDIPHVELDALYWGPGWTPAPRQVFRARITGVVRSEAWVVDGNYSKARDIVWSRAEMVVWLDYALPVILGRLVRRTVHRSIRREELWNGNRESLRQSLFSRESIVLWALKTYRRHRKEYSALLERPEYAHLKVVHLRSPRSARSWLAVLPAVRMN